MLLPFLNLAAQTPHYAGLHAHSPVPHAFSGRTVGQVQSRAGIIPEKPLSTDGYAVSPILLAFIHQFIRSPDDAFNCVVWMAHARAD